MNKFMQDVPAPAIVHQPSYAERQFLHTFVAGVLLPLGQSVTTGLVICIAGYTLAVTVFDAVDPFKSALTFGIVSMAITYLYLQRRWLSLTALERALNVDLNDDDVIGEEPEPQTVHIKLEEVRENGHYHADIFDLPASPDQLSTLALGLMNNMPASEKQWTGKGKPFSSQGFRTLKNEMIKRGLMELTNPKDARQGHSLTKAGRAVMKHFASPSPTPQAETDEN